MLRRKAMFGVLVAVTLAIGAMPLGGSSQGASAFVAGRSHGPVRVHRRRDQTVSENYNWSGYAVTGATGSATDAKGSWTVPAVNCATPGDNNGFSSFWVGIDGWTSDTVEQIGTDSDCVSPTGAAGTPTYYAWFEFYPQPAYYIGNPNRGFSGYTVKPGDVLTAEVKSGLTVIGPRRVTTTQFITTISDTRGGARLWSFSTSGSVRGAQQTSAEWIAETPSGCATPSGFCPLANFGLFDNGSVFTAISGTSYATVGGKTGAVGSFGSALQEAVMVNYPAGTTTLANPSALFTDAKTNALDSYSVTWLNPGP